MKTLTLAQARARVRNLCHTGEAAVVFEDEDLDSHIEDAMRDFGSELGAVTKGGWFEKTEDFTVAANDEDADLTALLDEEFAAIVELRHVLPNGRLVPVGVEIDGKVSDLFRATAGSAEAAPRAALRRGVLVDGAPHDLLRFGNTASATRTFRLRYRYAVTLEDDADVLPIPKEWAVVVLYDAAMRALAEMGQSERQYEALFMAKRAECLAKAKEAAGVFDSETTEDGVGSEMFGTG